MTHDICFMLITAGLFGLLFLVAEVLHARAKLPAEVTRKITHIGTGLLAIRFLDFRYIWEVGALCGLFFLILIWSKRHTALSSINGIERKSEGSTLYPIAVFLAFLLTKSLNWTPFYYLAPILVLAICDPAAAVGGRLYKKMAGIKSERKTLAGSFAFVVTGITIFLILKHISPAWLVLPFYALLPAIIGAAVAERVSKNGWDNLAIPLSMAVYFVVALFIHSHITAPFAFG